MSRVIQKSERQRRAFGDAEQVKCKNGSRFQGSEVARRRENDRDVDHRQDQKPVNKGDRECMSHVDSDSVQAEADHQKIHEVGEPCPREGFDPNCSVSREATDLEPCEGECQRQSDCSSDEQGVEKLLKDSRQKTRRDDGDRRE